MPRPGLTLIIITKDNARTLKRCLDSAAFVDEKILVDSGSKARGNSGSRPGYQASNSGA